MSDPMQNVSDDTRFPANLRWTPLEEVTEAGAYICRSTGDLIRIVARGRAMGAEELFEKQGTAPVYLTQVSMDPFVPIARARMEAANRDIEFNF